MKFPHLKSLTPVVALATLGLSSVASAGLTYQGATCYQNTDGSGYCYGSMLGFREDATTTSYASFREDEDGTRSFYARYTVAGSTAASSYSCIPDATVSSLWNVALSTRGYFYVAWNTAGTCTYLRVSNGSNYTNF
ncbi:hypothetical protein JY651_14050 [Pyxidicoccus parkwayensis]|uniref:Uncharacterized protein n=1 Tax=Pyxidicoccus parkwayensis TaxID=2813578 RepID=A0ABX7P646_9BACT|nr:hypothetical protein [Pyxidicoccus parkwaysis]QSQ25974.1 hypothetical protein JY651_14050 [Pyxidicoccus parkwaysis]